MPAFDNSQKSAATTFDISAAATQATTAVNLGKGGLPEGASCTVAITGGSAVAYPNGLKFHFEYTTDNGTTWRRAGSKSAVALNTAAGVSPQIVTIPIGLNDIVPDANAEADIDWRVVADIVATIASALDPIFTAYLTGRQGFPGPVD
jgi:hypothetical protein